MYNFQFAKRILFTHKHLDEAVVLIMVLGRTIRNQGNDSRP